jgi:glycosyltransferase involved in cell wall biosynthesis
VDRLALVLRRARSRNTVIRRLHPDVVHLQLLNRFTDAWMMPAGSIVATVHDVLPHERRLPMVAERALLSKLYRSLDAIVVHHRAVGEYLQANFAVATNRIHHIPLVIAPNGQPPEIRKLASPTVLFFGSFRRNKGIAELCEAIGLLAEEDHFRFHFAGRGDAEAEQTVRELAQGDRRVTAEIGYVTGQVKDKLFRTATLVVLPYTTFTSQSAVLGDAYAAGTPVLVADVGALGASVREDGTGWVLPSVRPDDIAESIRRCLSDPTGWAKRAERCTAVALERSPEAVAHSYRQLYATLHRH